MVYKQLVWNVRGRKACRKVLVEEVEPCVWEWSASVKANDPRASGHF